MLLGEKRLLSQRVALPAGMKLSMAERLQVAAVARYNEVKEAFPVGQMPTSTSAPECTF